MSAKRKPKTADLPRPLAEASGSNHCIYCNQLPDKPLVLCMGEGLWPDCEGLAHCFPKPTTPLIKPRVRKRAQKTTPATTDAAPPEILKVELISLETPQVIYPCSHPSLQFGAVNGAGDLAAITVTCSVCGKQGVYTLTVDPQQVSWQQS